MFYDAVENAHGLKHDPFKALVAPRPIGWISSISADGVANLAPYSFFNAVNDRPHIVMFSSTGVKDSVVNIDATGEFVCNLATFDLKDEMNTSSAAYGSQVDEFEASGLETAPSKMVRPPRVKRAPAALECRHLETKRLTDLNGVPLQGHVVFGQVVGIHIDDSLVSDGLVDITRARPIARLGYMDYAVVNEVFAMPRPPQP
ncbi:MAG: flavin reductase family protein [Pseudomonadota bacterium]